MLRKCPFGRQKCTQAAAYEKYLPTTHANVNLILASTTIRYPSSASDVLDTQTNVVGERPDSDQESDPKPTGGQQDLLSGDIVYESDTEVLNNTAPFFRWPTNAFSVGWGINCGGERVRARNQ